MARARSLAVVSAGAALLWLAVGRVGFANYDALYALIRGRELADGAAPTVDVPLAPTTHPLAELAGAVLAPLHPGTAEDVVVALAFVFLAAAALAVYRLGRAWFGWAAGLAGAAVLLTREPVLSYGVRAYVDLPYLYLILAALLIETRRERAGAPVLGLLALAGLLRPEAWLFSAAYLAWLWAGRRVSPGELALALAAPLGWIAYDLATTGDPLSTLTGTRENTRALERVTGLRNVPEYLPRRVGEILRIPGLAGAAAGLAVLWRRGGARLPLTAIALAAAAFAVLAAAGLPITTRYAFALAALGAALAGGGALGGRGAWRLLGLAVVALFAAFAPSQARRLHRTAGTLAEQQRIRDDLYAILDAHRLPPGPVGVANHRLVPLVALRADRRPASVVTAPRSAAAFIGPASMTVARRFILDPRDPVPRVARPPAGLRLVARNRSWLLYER